ncbi:MAG: substrate-binding domain-containing protein [Actinomycetes bacterium]
MTISKRRLAIAGLISISLVAAACGGDEETAENTEAPAAETTAAPAAETTEAPAADTTEAPAADTTAAPAEGGELELAAGEVFVTGSSTVEPVSIRVGELAAELSGGDLAVTVEGPGTGDGFQKFCEGGADVTGASRPIRDEEAQACADAGIEFVELEVAFDGLTVATSPANTAIECLDNAALYALLGPESEGFENWSDANDLATEVGSNYVPFPDAPLVVNGPGEESGTYDSFVEFAIADIAEERGTDEFTRADYASSPNDNLIVEGIEGADTSLGWVGYAFYEAEQGRMKSIAIEGEDGTCVAPTDETIADGSYPYSRSLYIYVNTASAAENPAVASYVELYLSDQGLIDQVGAAGYVSLPPDRVEATRSAWSA